MNSNDGPGASRPNAQGEHTAETGTARTPFTSLPPGSAGVQIALAIIEARRFKQPGSYREALGDVSDGALNTLIAELREADAEGNYPVKVVALGKYAGDDWLIADFGVVSRDAQCVGGAMESQVYVTTDQVHASEIRGDALCDAECYVAVRNHLPTIIAALEELLDVRVRARP